jgi:predicted HTH domain antitoxin
MKTATFSYPESLPALANLSPDAFEAEARMAMAMKLYELGRLTSGQAALMAGVSRVDFLLSCRQYGIASVSWDEEEISREFGGL